MTFSSVLHLASKQYGVVSRAQASDAGINNRQLARLRRQGVVVDVTTRTIRFRSSPDTFLARCAATSLHLADRGFLAGPTAARLHGLREMPHHPIAVTVPHGDRPRLPSWVALRSTSWYDARRDRRRVAGVLIAAEPHRMLFDLAARLDDRRFRRAADDCWHLGLVTPRSAAGYLGHHRSMGKDGTLRMQRWIDLALTQRRPTESGLELDLVEALRAVGLPEPTRQHPLDLPSGIRIHIDLAWPVIRLGVEPGHSWWHGGVEGVRRDQERSLGAQARGWQMIQLDESVRNDPQQAASMIRSAYHHRAALLAGTATIVAS